MPLLMPNADNLPPYPRFRGIIMLAESGFDSRRQRSEIKIPTLSKPMAGGFSTMRRVVVVVVGCRRYVW